jgi:transcriptional regulator with XRE-family HTH domain
MINMLKFHERLKELRIENNLTQVELSKATGLSQNAIAQWENEQRTPNANAVVVLAEYFKVSADYLLGIDD